MSVRLRKVEGKDNVWEVDIRVTLPDGTPARVRREAPVSGKAAAKVWAEKRAQALLRDGKPNKQRKEVPTLREFAPRFIEQYAKANQQKPSGVDAKQTIIRLHLLPLLGDRRLDEISSEDVQVLKSALSNKAPKTVNNVLSVLSVMLETAVEWREMAKMPCAITWMKLSKREARFHHPEAFSDLVAAAREFGTTEYLVALLGGEAGLRSGEMRALEWGDIDFANRILCVSRSDWNGQVTAPKSGQPRYIAMTKRLAAALQDAQHTRSLRVLCDAEGKPLTKKVVWGMMRRVGLRAGTQRGVHILRHTFCSRLALQAAPTRAIQALAGHQDIRTTERYMHLSPGATNAAIQLLERGGA